MPTELPTGSGGTSRSSHRDVILARPATREHPLFADDGVLVIDPKSTQEIVVTTGGGEVLRFNAFLSEGMPSVAIKVAAGSAHVTVEQTHQDMIDAQRTVRAKKWSRSTFKARRHEKRTHADQGRSVSNGKEALGVAT